jgi:ketosteroid isomerase-like protein
MARTIFGSRIRTGLTLVSLAWALAAAARPACCDEPATVPSAVEAANERFIRSFARGDAAALAAAYTDDAQVYAAALAAAYTDDAQVFPPNQEIVKGRTAVEAFWREAIRSGAKGLTLDTGEVSSSGNWAFESGRYTMSDASGKVIERGKYVVVWKNDRGTWKLHRDIWNTNP